MQHPRQRPKPNFRTTLTGEPALSRQYWPHRKPQMRFGARGVLICASVRHEKPLCIGYFAGSVIGWRHWTKIAWPAPRAARLAVARQVRRCLVLRGLRPRRLKPRTSRPVRRSRART